MRRRLLLGGSALFLILVFSIVFLVPGSRVNALGAAVTPTFTSTTTPDANQILNQASDARDKAIDAKNVAEEAAQQAQGITSFINTVLPIIGFVIAIIAGILVFFGYDTRKGVKEVTGQYKQELENYKQELKNVEALTVRATQAEKRFEQIDLALTARATQTDERFEHFDLAFTNLRLGDILFGSGQRDMAIEAYKEARKWLPSNALVNYSLGRAYSRTKQYDEAIQLLEESLNEKPDFPETSRELGLAYRRRGEEKRKADPNTSAYRSDYQWAIKYLERAVQLAPKDDDALAILGGLYKRLGDYQTSLDYYVRSSIANRDASYPLGNIGCIQWHEGYLEEARETFKRTEAVATLRIQRQGQDIHWDYYDRALARLMLGHKDEAIVDYRIAIDRTPGAVDLESVLDNLLFLKNTPHPKEAIVGLDEVIEEIEKQVARKNAVVV
jgi:tetratricopeptide (TPR) repeat protein